MISGTVNRLRDACLYMYHVFPHLHKDFVSVAPRAGEDSQNPQNSKGANNYEVDRIASCLYESWAVVLKIGQTKWQPFAELEIWA